VVWQQATTTTMSILSTSYIHNVLSHKFKFFKLREGMDEKVVDRERRERHVIRRYPLASMSVTQFGKSQEITADASSVSSTRGVVR